MNLREHWEKIYSTKLLDKLGWYKPHLETSLKWIKELGLDKKVRIIDVGGGASSLVDDLLGEGYRSITVMDLSKNALSLSKERLGERAGMVTWLEGDITSDALPAREYGLWHDRAVFHFLTDSGKRRQYLDNLLTALNHGGHIIIGTFAPEAPPTCSGLPVQRYTPEELAVMFGEGFELKKHLKNLHVTPGGVEQMYLYCHFVRQSDNTIQHVR